MDKVRYFFWLAIHSLNVLILIPPAGALLLCGVVGMVASIVQLRPAQWPRALFGGMLVLVPPAAILLCGVLFVSAESWPDPPAPDWPEDMIAWLLLAHVLLAALLVVLFRGVRAFVLFAAVAALAYACGAAFMSGMSVSGRWL